jgi:ferric-dicitrate binding protein FerR (iron transport regulator)
MSRRAVPEDWSILLNALADDLLSAEQEQQLGNLLRSNAEFRREYVCYCQFLTQLSWRLAPSEPALPTSSVREQAVSPATASAEPTRRFRRTRPHFVLGSLGLAVAFIVFGMLWWTWRIVGDAAAVRVSSVAGEVRILRRDQPSLSIRNDDLQRAAVLLTEGDQIQTDRLSSARLVFFDGTEIWVRPETKLTLAASDRVLIPCGELAARVTPRQPGRSLKFATPQAEVRVLGTELEILALARRSEIAVGEGRVQITRAADEASVTASAGQFFLVPESGPITSGERPLSPSDWSEDFEQGLPPGWSGRLVQEALPAGSRGAIGSRPGRPFPEPILEVRSPVNDAGLFAWQDDSMLHLTFKIQPPGWFHIELVARDYAQRAPPRTYCLIDSDLWQTSAGTWRTVHIPLSEFQPLTPASWEPTLGRIPIQIAVRGQSEAGSIVVDRIWIDRDAAADAMTRRH